MGPCLSAQKDRYVAYSAHMLKSAANNPPKDIEGNLIELFEKADKSKFRFDEVISSGSYSYQKSGETKAVDGLISDGIAEFKANPGKYVAISYQTNKTDWPEDQQNYTLYMRKGWQGLKPKEDDDGWQTWIMCRYEALPEIDIGSAADPHTDGMNYRGNKLHHPVNNPPLQPGRGMGCADIPGLKIIGDVDPNDVHQGQVGNCWLLSAISALAEFDGAVHKLFANTPGGIEDMPREAPNEYHVTLYDLSTWEPVDVVVDERLAANAQNPGKLLGATPSDDGELWVCYLEKAFAVHCGGWDEINGGQCTHAWSILTGCKETYDDPRRDDGMYQCLGKYNPNEDKWEAQHSSIKKTFPRHLAHEVARRRRRVRRCRRREVPRSLRGRPVQEDRRVGREQLHHRCRHGGIRDDTKDTDGIVDGHAYTVLRAIEDVAGSGFDMVQVRNPHGHGELENGYWDDDGPGWDEHPSVKKALRPVQRDDGIFWMSKEEFFKYFHNIYLCAKDMSDFLRD